MCSNNLYNTSIINDDDDCSCLWLGLSSTGDNRGGDSTSLESGLLLVIDDNDDSSGDSGVHNENNDGGDSNGSGGSSMC